MVNYLPQYHLPELPRRNKLRIPQGRRGKQTCLNGNQLYLYEFLKVIRI